MHQDRTTELVPDEMLDQMLLAVEATVHQHGWDGPGLLVALVDPLTLSLMAIADGKDVDEHLSAGESPVLGAVTLQTFGGYAHEVLVGTRAPEWTLGLVLVTEAWTYPEGVSPDVAAVTFPWDHPQPGEVRFCACVMRDGRTRWLERRRDGEARFRPEHSDDERLVSSLHRALDLSTPPAPEPIEHLVGRLWLTRAAYASEEAFKEGEALTWEDGALVGFGVQLGIDPAEPEAAELVTIGWEGLRQQAIRGEVEGVTPEEAEWMDEGMFARLVLEGTLAGDDLLANIESATDPDTTRSVRCSLEACGWL